MILRRSRRAVLDALYHLHRHHGIDWPYVLVLRLWAGCDPLRHLILDEWRAAYEQRRR